MFTYIYSLLIETDICDCRNVSVKLSCVYLCLSSRDLFIFSVRVFFFYVIYASVLSLFTWLLYTDLGAFVSSTCSSHRSFCDFINRTSSFCKKLFISSFLHSTVLEFTLRIHNIILLSDILSILQSFHLPVSCKSLADRCGYFGSCKPQINFFNIAIIY